jgi:hypothetical protein
MQRPRRWKKLRARLRGGVPQLERSRRFFATGKIRLERLLSESDRLFEARNATPNYLWSRAIRTCLVFFEIVAAALQTTPAQEGTRQLK